MKIGRIRNAFAVLMAILIASAATPLAAFAEGETGHEHVPSGVPVWSWSGDDTACVAVFVCDTCGEPFELEAEVTKEWMGEGPDRNGGGRYYFTAAVTVNGESFFDYSPVHVTEDYRAPNPCPRDGIDHGDSFAGRLLRFLHGILYALEHLFERNKYGD